MTTHIPPPIEARHAERIRSVRSPRGIEAWLIEDHTLPILSVHFGFKGGASLDPEGRSGAADLMCALLTEGAGDLGGTEFQEALADNAIRLWCNITPDRLAGGIMCVVQHAGRALELLGLALQQPNLELAAIERVRDRTLANLRQTAGKPSFRAARTFASEGFAGHAYARPPLGTLDSVSAITREDLLTLHPFLVNLANLRIGVVGAIDPKGLGALLDDAFAALPSAPSSPIAPIALGCLGERRVVRSAAPQSTILFGRPGLLRDDQDFLAAFVVNHCLGGSSASRLFQEVREKRGLCYSIDSGLETREGCCTWRGSTSVRNDRAEEAVAVIEAEIRRLAEQGIGEAELARAKGYLIGAYSLNLSNSGALAGRLLAIQIEGRTKTWLDMRNRGIDAVTVAAAARAIERMVGDGAFFTVLAGDPQGF